MQAAAQVGRGVDWLVTSPVGPDVPDEVQQLVDQQRAEIVALRDRIRQLRDRVEALEGYRRGLQGTGRDPLLADIVMTRLARVSLGPASIWGSDLLVDRGSMHGVAEGDVVVVAVRFPGGSLGIEGSVDGYSLLGKIISVGPISSAVRLVTDDEYAASVKILPGEHPGALLRGDDHGGMTLKFMPVRSKVETGMFVLTDGRDGLHPSNLLVGRVQSVTEKTLDGFKEVRLDPTVSLEEVKWVCILRRRRVPDPRRPDPGSD
ncbi:MAG: rod shape-determining protein MreC [Planctomycetota bacterium]